MRRISFLYLIFYISNRSNMYIRINKCKYFSIPSIAIIQYFPFILSPKKKVVHLLQLAVTCRPRLNQLQQRTDRSPLECFFLANLWESNCHLIASLCVCLPNLYSRDSINLKKSGFLNLITSLFYKSTATLTVSISTIHCTKDDCRTISIISVSVTFHFIQRIHCSLYLLLTYFTLHSFYII